MSDRQLPERLSGAAIVQGVYARRAERRRMATYAVVYAALYKPEAKIVFPNEAAAKQACEDAKALIARLGLKP